MKDLLPLKPVPLKIVEPWWIVHIGYVTEDDIRVTGLFHHNILCNIFKHHIIKTNLKTLV